MSLTLENISKSFGSIEVLKNIDLSFAPGEVTAIVGDNGAGKSTLLKTMAGIYAPDKGLLSLDGLDLTRRPAFAHRECGIEMVYQDLALAKQQDVTSNLWMGREITFGWTGILNRRAMKKRAQQGLEQLGIQIQDLTQPVGQLSGGQQQAVAIARALLFDPKVLLLDEPTAALAEREVQQVLTLIRQEKKQGRIVILVSHRLNDVFAVADRIVVMKHGQIKTDVRSAETCLSAIVEEIVS